MSWIRKFTEVGIADIPQVGGKNASLGEMLRELQPLGVKVPDGFAITAAAYRHFLVHNDLEPRIQTALSLLQRGDVSSYSRVSADIQNLMLAATIPDDLEWEIRLAFAELAKGEAKGFSVAVRSSATAEDLPTASFAGQQETFLHVQGERALLDAVRRCFASLFTGRAISYREDQGFGQLDVALSVGVQRMVAADQACSGVMFTIDTESGAPNVVMINSIYGLGENIVQGRVGPDEFYVHKATLAAGYKSLLSSKVGPKELRMAYDPTLHRLTNLPVGDEERSRLSLQPEEVLTLARWAVVIEDHYSKKRGQPTPMDIEWAKDANTGELFIVQARPETVQSQKTTMRLFSLNGTGKRLLTGLAVGDAIGSGPVRVIRDPRQMSQFKPGEVLVTHITDPDWEPIMKAAAGIVTERGGRTSHAAIVARELGIPAVVGTGNCTEVLQDGQDVTLSCAEGEAGVIYEGRVPYHIEEVDPQSLPHIRTKIMMNVGNPEQAFKMAQLPGEGVGLARMEFIFASWVKVHPLALTRFSTLAPKVQREVEELTRGYSVKTDYFVDRLSQGIATLAAAFYPRDVILRFSDFKTNEYCHLLGGADFEPKEENPMLGWRGASRYYHPNYKEGFMLEVAAVRRVREVLGLKNLKVMIPFCRTPEEGRKVLAVMEEGGLVRGKDGLEVYVMAEIPSNVFLAEEFAEIFDGFSIGSNDLTQLILGVDRDSDTVAPLFNERNPAVKEACTRVIKAGHMWNRKVGICGQAPSDYPDFAAFLVSVGIDSISLTPDAVVRTWRKIAEVESGLSVPV